MKEKVDVAPPTTALHFDTRWSTSLQPEEQIVWRLEVRRSPALGLGPRPSAAEGALIGSVLQQHVRSTGDQQAPGEMEPSGSEALCALLLSLQLHSCTQTQAGGLHGTTDAANHLVIIQVVLRAPWSPPSHPGPPSIWTCCWVLSAPAPTGEHAHVRMGRPGLWYPCAVWVPRAAVRMSLTVSCWSHPPGCNLLAHPRCSLIRTSPVRSC